jgi:hypothetical protein
LLLSSLSRKLRVRALRYGHLVFERHHSLLKSKESLLVLKIYRETKSVAFIETSQSKPYLEMVEYRWSRPLRSSTCYSPRQKDLVYSYSRWFLDIWVEATICKSCFSEFKTDLAELKTYCER